MANDLENQIMPEEFDYQAELQRDRNRNRQAPAAGVGGEGAAEKPETNLNIIELTLVLFLALGVDFGIGWLGGKIAMAINAIPAVGQAASVAVGVLVKFTTLTTTMILGLWCLLRLKKFPTKRFGATTIIEHIPFIGELAPGWTAFVLSIIIKEKIMPILAKYSATAEKIKKTVEKTEQAAKKIGGAAAKVAAKL